jgi:hypothetical protein
MYAEVSRPKKTERVGALDLFLNNVSVVRVVWHERYLVQRQRVETLQAKCLRVMWGMGKVCEDLLRRHHLDFVLEFRMIEASTNQRELAIWVLSSLLRREFLESLHNKVGFRGRAESKGEYLLDLSRIPTAWNPVAEDHMAIPDGER